MSGPNPCLMDLLTAKTSVRLVYQFGSSVVEGGPSPRDLDLGLWFGRRLSWDEERHLRADAALLDPRIDLVLLDDAGVVLRHEAVTGGRCILVRDEREEAEFEIRVLAAYRDFQVLRRRNEQDLRRRVEARRGAA
jgi:hypothetical protein